MKDRLFDLLIVIGFISLLVLVFNPDLAQPQPQTVIETVYETIVETVVETVTEPVIYMEPSVFATRIPPAPTLPNEGELVRLGALRVAECVREVARNEMSTECMKVMDFVNAHEPSEMQSVFLTVGGWVLP